VLRDWDIETGKCISTMPAHELGIKCVEARDGVVMTGSLDMSVKLWDASSFNSIATLDCVGDSVMDLEIVAGSWLLAAGAPRRAFALLDASLDGFCLASVLARAIHPFIIFSFHDFHSIPTNDLARDEFNQDLGHAQPQAIPGSGWLPLVTERNIICPPHVDHHAMSCRSRPALWLHLAHGEHPLPSVLT